jgi:hypothetical protein
MAELVFERHPVDCGESCISGRFGEIYRIDGRAPYPHRGVDYNVRVGTPVFAPAAGVVVPFNNDGSFGIAVCIDHPGTPWYSLYAHLSSKQVGVGDQVRTGQLLGYSGNTGFVTGPHLHWQVCRSALFPPDISQSTDPLAMLGARPAPSAGLEAFLGEVLAGLGFEATPKRVAMMLAWAAQEGISNGSNASRHLSVHWNPLATTRSGMRYPRNRDFDNGNGPGNWNTIRLAGGGTIHVGVYRDRETGIRATVDTIAQDYYANIRESLRRETGLDAAVGDFETYVGADSYGARLVAQWKSIGGAAGTSAPPAEEEEDEMADSELREAMAKREEIRAVASNMDLPTVERAWTLLREAGVIPERRAS